MKVWLLATMLFVSFGATSRADEKVVAHWSGVGMLATRPFHLAGPGEIQWKASGFFQATMYKAGSVTMPDVVANQLSGGPGTYYVAQGGDYYIKFSAMEQWSAQVVVLPQVGNSLAPSAGPQPQPASPEIGQTGLIPTEVGSCSYTTVANIGTRLLNTPGSGSAITFTNKGFQVSYRTIPQIENSKAGDRVVMCLGALPENCPSGDQRGKLYLTVNLRTLDFWAEADSSHSCGAA